MSRGSDEHVSSDQAAWDHLGRLIRERRAELGLTQREVHSVGGPSPATLYQLESGQRGSYRPHILRRLERALGWGAGSVRRILAGGLPALDGDAEPPARERRASRPPRNDHTVDSAEWIAGFRNLPIDTHDKLLILSTLLQELAAGLAPVARQEPRSSRQGHLTGLPGLSAGSDRTAGS
ncbi:hypothetical protein GCM10010399_42200 [Dactylosporangium fulvum]|uniref:Transcriptional regulator n=1 Tax=Dactylosporangium fulvum TaxID=53359 RepID=A0ABY5VWH1_9ACTN|nr:helix-turn-helix transcriptional regulator [Dactylosporangium fulvum]UWP81600.1 transcriptional regulator [Dactylosporangium fulvum]